MGVLIFKWFHNHYYYRTHTSHTYLEFCLLTYFNFTKHYRRQYVLEIKTLNLFFIFSRQFYRIIVIIIFFMTNECTNYRNYYSVLIKVLKLNPYYNYNILMYYKVITNVDIIYVLWFKFFFLLAQSCTSIIFYLPKIKNINIMLHLLCFRT